MKPDENIPIDNTAGQSMTQQENRPHAPQWMTQQANRKHSERIDNTAGESTRQWVNQRDSNDTAGGSNHAEKGRRRGVT